MRSVFLSFAAGGLVLSACSAAPCMGQLVSNGVAVGQLVIPDSPSSADSFAANEVQTYVQQMTGAVVPIVPYSQRADKTSLWFGNNPHNTSYISQLNTNYPGNSQAFALVGPDDQCSVIGESDDAEIWAAWQFLYDRGVRWLMPGPNGTYVPTTTSVGVPVYSDYEAPATTARGGYAFRSPSSYQYVPPDLWNDYSNNGGDSGLKLYQVFNLHMRMNQNSAYTTSDMIEPLGSGHSYAYYLPGSTYGQANPTWYNLINGVYQISGSQSQVNFTSSAAAAQFALNVESNVQAAHNNGIPLGQLPVWVSPNDGTVIDQNSGSQALLDTDGSYTSCVINFANLVSADVQGVYPGQRILVFAYSNYSTPPNHATPGANICPVLTAWTASNSFAVDDSKPLFSSGNSKYENSWVTWAGESASIGGYTYYGHYAWFTPWPMLTQIETDIPAMEGYSNFYYFNSQTDLHWGTQGLQDWLYAMMLWKSTASPQSYAQSLITKYCQAAYGPAATVMQSYYSALQSSMDGQAGKIGGLVQQIPSVLTPSVISTCNGYISQAQGMYSQMDPATKWRTQLACDAWTKSAEFASAVSLFNTGSGMTTRQTILNDCSDVTTFAQSSANGYEGQYAFDNPTLAASVNTITGALSVNLSALPAGNSVYADSFGYGGAIKFFGTYTGFSIGAYGYELAPSHAGTITAPIQASSGHTVTKATVSFSVSSASNLTGTLWAIAPNGTKYVLSTNPSAMSNLSIPSAALGGSVEISLTYSGSSTATVLTGCNFNVTVQ